MKRKYANGLKYQTQALMGATRLASGKIQLLFSRVCIFPFHYPDAGRVAPISASVWCSRFFAARFWQLKMPKFGVAFEDDFERPSFQPTLAEFKNSTT